MAITSNEKKRRQEVLDREKQIISKLNDQSEIRERVQRDKELNNQVVDRVEGPQQKIATPAPDKSL